MPFSASHLCLSLFLTLSLYLFFILLTCPCFCPCLHQACFLLGKQGLFPLAKICVLLFADCFTGGTIEHVWAIINRPQTGHIISPDIRAADRRPYDRYRAHSYSCTILCTPTRIVAQNTVKVNMICTIFCKLGNVHKNDCYFLCKCHKTTIELPPLSPKIVFFLP